MSPTPKRGAARSPIKDRGCCAGRSSRAQLLPRQRHPQAQLPPDRAVARCEQGARRDCRVRFTHSQLRATATARSEPPQVRRCRRGRSDTSLSDFEERHDPSRRLRVVELIEPDLAVPSIPLANHRREYMLGSRSGKPIVSPRRVHYGSASQCVATTHPDSRHRSLACGPEHQPSHATDRKKRDPHP